MGSYRKRPQLTRSRGMLAAGLLAVVLAGTYGVIGAISLRAVSGTGNIAHLVGRVPAWIGSVAFAPPAAHDLVSASPGAGRVSQAAGSSVTVDLGRLSGATTVADALRLTNTSSTSQTVQLAVVGAPGMRAVFGQSGESALRLTSGQQASVALVTSPLHAGPIRALVRIAVGTGGSYDVPVVALQAPLAPGPLSAAAAAGGSVRLTWAASPSTGVGGYAVLRAPDAAGPWMRVATAASTAYTDPVGNNGVTEYYRVQALAAGISPALASPSGPVASAVTDNQAPSPPTLITVPVVNIANVAAVPVTVALPADSLSSDTVSVSISDGTTTVGGSAAGGRAQVIVPVDASSLADGPLQVTVTLTDAIGNSVGFRRTTIKDTLAPPVPLAVTLPTDPPNTIDAANVTAVPVTVSVPQVDPGALVHVALSSGSATVQSSAPAAAGTVTVNVDATSLPDGPVSVGAWLTDAAGNPSAVVQGPPAVKDTAGPAAPSSFTADAGGANPAGYVNAASQRSATFTASFPTATPAGGTVTLTVAGQTFQFPGGEATYTVGPLDLSALPDGPVALTGTVASAVGNTTSFVGHAVKDTVAPSAPTSFGVAAGAQNPAGYVNIASQTQVSVVAQFADPTNATDTVALQVGGLSLGVQPGGGSTVSWSGDLSSLADGQLQLTGTITDAAGNSITFTGQAIKATVAPAGPVAAFVQSSPANVIHDREDACVRVMLRFGAVVPVGSVAVVTLRSGDVAVSVSVVVGSGSQPVPCIDARSLPEGLVSLSGTVTDAAGNVTAWQGTSAHKRD